MIKLGERSVAVRKRGPVSSELSFEEGSTSESAYNMPFGAFYGFCPHIQCPPECGGRKDRIKSFLQTQHQWRTLLGL